MRRRGSLAFVVVLVALVGALASGCTDGGGSVIAPSPEPPPIKSVPVDPSKGEFQVSEISVNPPANTTLREGDSWQISFWFWCRPGLWYGLIYIRDDGARLADNSVSECRVQERFMGTSLTGRLNANGRVYGFMRGHAIRPELATTTAPYEWLSGSNYTLLPGIVPPTTWVIE